MGPLFFIPLLLVSSVALTGCGKRQPPATANSPPTALDQATGSSPPTTSASALSPESNTNQPLDGLVHPFMTSQLHIFVKENGRLPKDFAEFARARMDSVPRAPEGMKWAIDLTTEEVKMVKK